MGKPVTLILALFLAHSALASDDCNSLLADKDTLIQELAGLRTEITELEKTQGQSSAVRALRDIYDAKMAELRALDISPKAVAGALEISRDRLDEAAKRKEEQRASVTEQRRKASLAFSEASRLKAPPGDRMTVAGARVFGVSLDTVSTYLPQPRNIFDKVLGRTRTKPRTGGRVRMYEWKILKSKVSAKQIDIPDTAGAIEHYAFSDDGRWFVTLTTNQLRVVDLQTGSVAASVDFPAYINTSALTHVSISRDGTLVAGGADRLAHLWRRSGQSFEEVPFGSIKKSGHSGVASVSANGKYYARMYYVDGDTTSTVEVWKTDGTLAFTADSKQLDLYALIDTLSLSPSGKFLYASNTHGATLVNVETGEIMPLDESRIELFFGTPVFDPEENFVIARVRHIDSRGIGNGPNGGWVYETSHGYRLSPIILNGKLSHFDFGVLNDGRLLSLDGTGVRIWDRALQDSNED